MSRMLLFENKIKKISCSLVCFKFRILLFGYNNLEKILSGFFMCMFNFVVLDLVVNIGFRELFDGIFRFIFL